MKRGARIMLITVATAVSAAVLAFVGLPLWVTYCFNVSAHVMHEGRQVADAIYANDRSIDVGCYTDGHGHADVVIREVFDASKQDQIIQWARHAKTEQHIRRVIVITFQKKAMPSEVILREVEI